MHTLCIPQTLNSQACENYHTGAGALLSREPLPHVSPGFHPSSIFKKEQTKDTAFVQDVFKIFKIFVSWSLIWLPINLFPSWNPMTSSSLLFSISVFLCSKARPLYVAQRSLKATPAASVSRVRDYRCAAPGLTPCSQFQVWLQLIREPCLCPYTDQQSRWNWTLCAGLTRQRTRATSCLLRFLVIKLI